MSPEKCVCGERGQGSHNCKVFNHGPMYEKAFWMSAPQSPLRLHNIVKGYAVDETGGYYFWDETEADCHGPYETLDHAREACAAYARDVLG